MARESYFQQVMDAEDPDDLGLAKDSFERRLRDELTDVVSPADFVGWHKESTGRPPSDPLVLTGMLLLQMRYTLTDKQVVKSSLRDRGFRYALRLRKGQRPPSVTTFRRFRGRLRREKGDDFLHRRVLALAKARDLIPDIELQAQDSTNTDCRGAVVDTFNLIATGIRQVLRVVARALGREPGHLAEEWEMSQYLARSIKGQASIDWTSEGERNRLLTKEIRDSDRLSVLVDGLGVTLPPTVADALALLKEVTRQDVEELGDGSFKIKKGTKKGRVVSVTDPEARHGRKSSSKVITGFKTHLQGTITSQFVTGIVMSDAGKHDSEPSPDLIEQSAEVGLKPRKVLGDGAYGTGPNIRACAELGVSILAKLSRPSSTNCIGKREFDVDLQNMSVTCPGGQTTTEFTMVKDPEGGPEKVHSFKFPKAACQACPLVQQCNSDTRKGKRRFVKLSAHEAELQRMKEFNATPRAKDVLRSRSAVERLISHLVRMGMRHARFFGMHLVQYQAYLTAATYNLQRIFTLTRCTAS